MKNLTERIEEIKDQLSEFGSPIHDPLIKLIITLLDELVAKVNE